MAPDPAGHGRHRSVPPGPRSYAPVLMPDRLDLTISSRSDAVRVVAGADRPLEVDGATAVTGPDGSIDIRATGRGRGRILVRCPAGSDVTVGTASVRVETTGPLGTVRVVTGSGRVEVEQAHQVEVRATSGRVTVGTCDTSCRIVTKTGRVQVGRSGTVDIAVVSGLVRVGSVGGATVQSVSGSVTVGGMGGAHISVRSMTGAVEVTLPPGPGPALSVRSSTGRIRCAVPDGDDGVLDLETSTGSIRVTAR